MSQRTTAPILVVGLGCRHGCSAEHVWALLERVLSQAVMCPRTLNGMASIDLKAHEPGLIELAEHLKLELQVFSAQQLEPYAAHLSARSEVAFARTGCWGVAESAALALAEQLTGKPATLLITRQSSAMATVAVATAG